MKKIITILVLFFIASVSIFGIDLIDILKQNVGKNVAIRTKANNMPITNAGKIKAVDEKYLMCTQDNYTAYYLIDDISMIAIEKDVTNK